MAEIQTGQYEVILRKYYKAPWDAKVKVPSFYREVTGVKDPNKQFVTLKLNMEFRKDIKENQDLGIAGDRIIADRPFLKTVNLTDGTTERADYKFIKDLYDSVDATSDFKKEELFEHMIDKPVLITLDVNPDGYNNRTEYTIKKIEKTENPDVQPSALEDELDKDSNLTADDNNLAETYDI